MHELDLENTSLSSQSLLPTDVLLNKGRYIWQYRFHAQLCHQELDRTSKAYSPRGLLCCRISVLLRVPPQQCCSL